MRSRVSGVFAGKVRRAALARYTALALFDTGKRNRILFKLSFVAVLICDDALNEEDMDPLDILEALFAICCIGTG